MDYLYREQEERKYGRNPPRCSICYLVAFSRIQCSDCKLLICGECYTDGKCNKCVKWDKKCSKCDENCKVYNCRNCGKDNCINCAYIWNRLNPGYSSIWCSRSCFEDGH